MTKSIATEKEKTIEEFKRFILESHVDAFLLKMVDDSLDHIASVARQEGREEAIEELKKYESETGECWFYAQEKLKQNENG